MQSPGFELGSTRPFLTTVAILPWGLHAHTHTHIYKYKYLMGQTKSTKVSPFRIIRMKLIKEGRANYILLNKKFIQPNKICMNILFVQPCIEHFLRLLSPLSVFFLWVDISIFFDFFQTIRMVLVFSFFIEIFPQISICVFVYPQVGSLEFFSLS